MRNLRTIFLIILLAMAFYKPAFSQDDTQKSADEALKGRVDGIDENVTGLMTDMDMLKKIKISGYFQVNYEKTEKMNGLSADPYDATTGFNDNIQARFRLRRMRLKVTYDAGLTQYVFQGDFSNSGFALKDFYLNITDPWTKMLSLTVGQFNRPVYEVEYSSSVREAPERSQMCLTLNPNERDLGAMITFNSEDLFKFQLAAFNNTFLSDVAQNNPVFRDNNLYYMARLTRGFNLMQGIDLDLGVSGRFGSVRSNAFTLIPSDVGTKATVAADSAHNYGKSLDKSWFGGELQLYVDDGFGGFKILGEYMTGNSVDDGTTGPGVAPTMPASSVALASRKLRERSFAGYYVMLVKNLGTEWQLAGRLDQYNPNTKIDITKVDNVNDLAITTIGFGIHNYTFANCRITLWYDMPSTKTQPSNIDPVTKKETSVLLTTPKANLLTVRFQYKF